MAQLHEKQILLKLKYPSEYEEEYSKSDLMNVRVLQCGVFPLNRVSFFSVGP